MPLLLGLGKHPHPDVVRPKWGDRTTQAEFLKPPPGSCTDLVQNDSYIDW